MRTFQLRLLEPPDCFQSGEHLSQEIAHETVPWPGIFQIGTEQQEYACYYGYIMLLAQYLEYHIVECVLNIRLCRVIKKRNSLQDNLEERPTFEKAIQELESVLDRSHRGTRDFIDALHKARKARNRLTHCFYSDWEGTRYFLSSGGCAKKLEELKRYEPIFFPLIGVVSMISRGYAADFGVTNELIDRIVAKDEAEKKCLDQSLQDLDNPTENDNEASNNG